MKSMKETLQDTELGAKTNKKLAIDMGLSKDATALTVFFCNTIIRITKIDEWILILDLLAP